MSDTKVRFFISALSKHCGGAVVALKGDISLDELSLEDVKLAFQEYGALVLRSFRSDVAKFLAFTAKFSDRFSSYEGGAFRGGTMGRQKVNGLDTLLTVTGSNQEFPIPLHGEMYYLGKPPALLWFFCQTSPQTGGETTIADGRKIYAALNHNIRIFFQKNRIKYIRHLKEDQWGQVFGTSDLAEVQKMCRNNNCVLFVNCDRSLRTEYVCSALTEHNGAIAFVNSIPAVYLNERFRLLPKGGPRGGSPSDDVELRVRMADDSLLPEGIMSEVLRVAESLTTPVRWRDGDVLMVDNRSHMHGRNASPPGHRTIFVRMAETSWIA